MSPTADVDETCISQTSLARKSERGEILIALAVFFCACIYLWPLRDFVYFNADEGFTLIGGQRILHGQVPYRDFFTLVTPGSLYLMALWFKLFGTSLIVARTVLIAYSGVFGAITYLLTRRAYDRQTALFAAALLVVGCMPSRFIAIHNWDSTLFALLAVYFAQRVLEDSTNLWWFLVGLTAGLTFVMEQSKGAGLLLGLAIAGTVLSLIPKIRRPWSIGNLCAGGTGFAIPLGLMFAYFASQHAVRAMVEACYFPLTHYSVVNRVTFGAVPISSQDLHEMFFRGTLLHRFFVSFCIAPMFLVSTFALLVVAASAYAVLCRWKTPLATSLDLRILGGCAFFGVFLSTLATGRADINHLLYLAPLFMYLLPSLLDVKHKSLQFLYKTRPVIAWMLLFSFTAFGLVTLLPALAHPLRTETRRGTVRFAYPDEVLPYVQEVVPPGQHLYVHPYQAFYSFMTGTLNPTRFEFLQPGFNTPDQYESAIRDLALDRTPYVLLDPNFGADKIPNIWPSTPIGFVAVDSVTDYIVHHYRVCRVLNATPRQVWSFYFMVRNNMECPLNRQTISDNTGPL